LTFILEEGKGEKRNKNHEKKPRIAKGKRRKPQIFNRDFLSYCDDFETMFSTFSIAGML
jgi:hypothetical protein